MICQLKIKYLRSAKRNFFLSFFIVFIYKRREGGQFIGAWHTVGTDSQACYLWYVIFYTLWYKKKAVVLIGVMFAAMYCSCQWGLLFLKHRCCTTKSVCKCC